MLRLDLSKYLVHWTKGDNYEEAFDVLRQIVYNRIFLGSNGSIRGGWSCVCFTEAPERVFHQASSRYKPFGIQIPKAWLFEKGGRPVIYQASHEYELLNERIRWRHVRYEPHTTPPVDFSWEREWRIQAEELAIDPTVSRILVPHARWADALIDEHEYHEYGHIQLLASTYGEHYLAHPINDFGFSYAVIPS